MKFRAKEGSQMPEEGVSVVQQNGNVFSPWILMKHENRRVLYKARLFMRYGMNLFAFLFFFNSDNFATLVMPAAGTHSMRRANLTTVWAGYEVNGCQAVVRAPAVTATARMFTFGLGSHAFSYL